jgi:predicted MFS family arabinose efflux permease
VLLIVSNVWAAMSPNYGSFAAARILAGVGMAPVEGGLTQVRAFFIIWLSQDCG